MSLDGFIGTAAGNGSLAWTVQDQEVQMTVHDGGDGARPDTLVLGNTTFQLFRESWVPFLDQPDAPELMQTFARELTAMRKVVFSRSATGSDWANSEFHPGDVAGVVGMLKAGDGPGMMIMGSGSIVRQLTDAGLIDEYTVILTPVILGSGVSMFRDAERRGFELIDARPFDSGNVILRYRPIRTPSEQRG